MTNDNYLNDSCHWSLSLVFVIYKEKNSEFERKVVSLWH